MLPVYLIANDTCIYSVLLCELFMFRFSGGYGRKRSSVQVYDDVYDDDINGLNGFLRYVNIMTLDDFANIVISLKYRSVFKWTGMTNQGWSGFRFLSISTKAEVFRRTSLRMLTANKGKSSLLSNLSRIRTQNSYAVVIFG